MKFIANIETFPGAGSIAWADSPKMRGTVAEAETPEEAVRELLISLRAKIAYDYGIQIEDIHGFHGKEAELLESTLEEIKSTQGNGKKEIKFSFA